MEVRFLWCSLSVLSAHTVLLLLVSLVPQLFLCCSTSIIWILSVSLKTRLYIPPWAFPTPILTFEHLFSASICFSIIYWLVSMSPPLLMFFPRQARGLLSVQILLHAAFRTTGISCLLLHLIIWWACVPGFPLLHQTLLSSAPLLADPPTASPLSVGTLQVFILSPPPFLFIVSILTNSSSQTASVSYNIIPPIVIFFSTEIPSLMLPCYFKLFRWDFLSRPRYGLFLHFCLFRIVLFSLSCSLKVNSDFSFSPCFSICTLIKSNNFIPYDISKSIHGNLSSLLRYLSTFVLVSKHPFAVF